jgi:hypothetical protein
LRAFWNYPVYRDIDLGLMYGWETIHNFNLVGGRNQINQLLNIDFSYKY